MRPWPDWNFKKFLVITYSYGFVYSLDVAESNKWLESTKKFSFHFEVTKTRGEVLLHFSSIKSKDVQTRDDQTSSHCSFHQDIPPLAEEVGVSSEKTTPQWRERQWGKV